MILIGERINTGFKDIKQAVLNKDPAPLRHWARLQSEAGAHYLDVNLGAVSGKPEDMIWMIEQVQAVTDVPISIDTNKVAIMREAVRVCKQRRGRQCLHLRCTRRGAHPCGQNRRVAHEPRNLRRRLAAGIMMWPGHSCPGSLPDFSSPAGQLAMADSAGYCGKHGARENNPGQFGDGFQFDHMI